MSFTIKVPDSVPSETHNSAPCIPSVALKKSKPFPVTVSEPVAGPVEEFGLIFFTNTVPTSVPSLFQSCPLLFKSSSAVKKRVPFTLVR